MHLAHRIARQVFDEDHAFRQFKFGEFRRESCLHRFFVEPRTRGSNDDRHDSFPKILMRQTDDRAFDHSGKRVDPGFHFLRIDVATAGNDQILGAPDDMDVAVRVDCAEIAGDKKTIA